MTSMWFLLFLLVDPWGTLSVSGHRCTETRHSGLIERVTFDCSSRNIRQLPVNISSRTTELNLAMNTIITIPTYAFQHLPNLTLLNLTFCGIRVLEENCFAGLLHLRELVMPYNDFNPARLPRETFACLPSLRLLSIAEQGKAGEYPTGILEDLSELRTLSVTSQDINLPDVYGRLPKLDTLILDGYTEESISNAMSRITADTFAAIRDSNVTTLTLRRTNVIHIDAGALSNFKNLRAFIVYANKPLDVKKAVFALGHMVNTSIDTVVLDGTFHYDVTYGLQAYDINDFCDGPVWKNLKRLSLRNVLLTTFVPRDVHCLSALQELSVAYNRLTFSMPHDTGKLHHLPQLRIIDISHTNVLGPGYIYHYCRSSIIHFHADDFFPRVPQFRRVDNLTVFEESAKEYTYSPNVSLLPGVRYIDASTSNFKRVSGVGKVISFSHPNSVLFLNVSGAHILSRVNGLLVGLMQLQVLDASDGVVESIHPDFLRHFPLLRVLNQSHNSLGKGNNNFSAIFSFGRTLEEVDLSNNRLSYIEPSTFSACKMLQQIKLHDNMLKCLDIALGNLTSLDLIDIRGNHLPFLNESFTSELDRLGEINTFSIDMRRNDLICNCESVSFIRWVQTTLVEVIGRSHMTCLVNNSHERLMDVSVADLLDKCNGSRRNVWKYIYIVLVVSIVITLMVTAAWVGSRHVRQVREQENIQEHTSFLNNATRYDVAVLFDEYETEMQTWIENELVKRAEQEWNLRLFLTYRDLWQHDGSTLDCIGEALDMSKMLILCITKSSFNNNITLASFRMDFDGRRSHNKYIFLCFDEFQFSSDTTAIEILANGGQALRLCWDERFAGVFWDRLRRRLLEHEDENTDISSQPAH